MNGLIKFNSILAVILQIIMFEALIWGATAATTGTAVSVVTLNVAPYIAIEPQSEVLNIDPELVNGDQKIMMAAKLSITTNTPWQLIAKDVDLNTAGHMTEWTGTGYGTSRLKAPMVVAAENQVALPNAEGTPVQTGSSAGTQDIALSFIQDVASDDKPLDDEHTYRIVVSFTGSALI